MLTAAASRLAGGIAASSVVTQDSAGFGLRCGRLRPSHIGDVRHDGDLVITVCDLAHEELAEATAVHWSIPDPVPAGDPASFDAALAQLADRVRRLAPRLTVVS